MRFSNSNYLEQRLEELRARGLLDIKFSLNNRRGNDLDTALGEVAALLDAFDRGASKEYMPSP